ncbi:MAG: Panacea domain-containing protein [Chloroflexi bacterium]|nr:Panacea domain-containing protein [Chloroflexota bacterium]
MSEYQPEFDECKFRNLVLYIGQRAWDDATLGKTRLYKTLWLSDFLAYARLGHSITGADYVHMPQGPGPDNAEQLLQSMLDDGELQIRSEPRYAYAIQRPLAQREPELDELFAPSEIAIVEEVLRQFDGQHAVDTSEWSHEHSVGWRLTEDGERIPYETIFLSAETPTIDDERWAEGVLRLRSA